MKIKNSHLYLVIGIFATLAISGFVLQGVFLSPKTTSNSINAGNDGLKLRFEELSTNGNSFCFGPDAVLSKSDSAYLIGSCCGPMQLHRYQEQVEGLKKYSNIDKIPSDPYNISVSLAKDLLNSDKAIVLTPSEQQIYNDAMKMSDEGGPCCCMCWRWYVYEGLAKVLIREHNFTAQQVTEVWNLSDGCGGEGHEHLSAQGMISKA